MSQRTNRIWVYGPHPTGTIDSSSFEMREEVIPALEEGQYLAKTEFLTINPAIRKHWNPGGVAVSPNLGRVIESKNPNIKVGEYIINSAGAQEYFLSGYKGMAEDVYDISGVMKVNPIEGLPIQVNLHALGLVGMTAYWALFDIGKPILGETVLVSGAAGGVGSLACQMAKLAGCEVIGIAGSDSKCQFLKEELGCDHAINYKSESVADRVKDLAPSGVDIYFDNVGGSMLDEVMLCMAQGARIIVNGETSQVEKGLKSKGDGTGSSVGTVGPKHYFNLAYANAKMEGFLIFNHMPKFPIAVQRISKLLLNGSLKYQEHVTRGFDRLPDSLAGVLRGENIGAGILDCRDRG